MLAINSLHPARSCLQGAKKRLEFRDSKRPSTAPYAAQQQQQQAADAASEGAGSAMSCATAAGRELYERGMEMKHRQEQIREQLRKASGTRCVTTNMLLFRLLAAVQAVGKSVYARAMAANVTHLYCVQSGQVLSSLLCVIPFLTGDVFQVFGTNLPSE